MTTIKEGEVLQSDADLSQLLDFGEDEALETSSTVQVVDPRDLTRPVCPSHPDAERFVINSVYMKLELTLNKVACATRSWEIGTSRSLKPRIRASRLPKQDATMILQIICTLSGLHVTKPTLLTFDQSEIL